MGENGIQIAMIRILVFRSNVERVGNLRQHVYTFILTSNERQKISELKLQIRSIHKKCLN